MHLKLIPGVTDDPGDYIALEEQSKNTPAPKYQDLTEKEAPTQVSGYERTILETADAAPKAMPRQGLKRQTDYQYEDVNLGETDARKLPSVPQPDLQSEDDTEYEVPEMFEEYTGVHINTLGASKPITPRPMKILSIRLSWVEKGQRSLVKLPNSIGQQHPWTAAVKLQNKSKNFFKALLPYDHSRVRLDTDGSDIRSDYINASYIKNHQGKVSFIAAQGPREGTNEDFWRMVWKEDVETIVMLVDKDGTEQHSKDAQYWPHEVNRSQKYGAFTVLLMETTAFRSYILREMNVIKGNEKVHTSVDSMRFRAGSMEVFLLSLLTSSLSSNRSRIIRMEANIYWSIVVCNSLLAYWPQCSLFSWSDDVICKKIDESDVFTRRQFEVKHKRAEKSLIVDHFSFHGWSGNKPDVHKLREFIKYSRTKGTGPALVHCINGVGLSAVYVTVISELERIEKEGAVDVFRTLHRLRKQCPHAVQTQDEYLLCYELLRDHLNNPEEYAVVF
ncbi:Receptor-type tyrosine-protein phosphatase mu [Apostichopus japonicus]|uniref:protein-tyrosine-phosphatase n=1 Tax=Stichopus japonicus TaxID=307972 RepID=A0A2G8K180_STIJA|nr:Receptor-type tyrosine-protein phosphatase mu [Apostichopus japonicus]